jgi:outer membrane protein
MSWRRAVLKMLTIATVAMIPALAAAQGTTPSSKVGFVNAERVMRQARAAVELQKTLDAEFQKRSKDIAAGAPAEVERRQRALVEEMNQKREDALKGIVEKANAAIRRIAEQDNLDLVLYEATFASPRVDLTDRVIKALDSAK